jgi:sterol desaturase/sphingolipid hydroxylase (fatty acid hydroxylase superfamily)
MVLAEILILKKVKGKVIPWLEIVANLHSGQVIMWLFRSLEVFLFGFLLTHINLHWVEQWPTALQWIFAFIAWDFCFYWMHRLHHKVPFLWAIHSVHHQGENVNLSLAMRNSWYSSLSNFLFIAPLAIIGVPLEVFVVVSSIHYSVQFYNHTALVKKSGLLDKILVTPSNHRVHHGLHPLYINKNFGGTLLTWDKIFGSYQAERDDIETKYGLHKPVLSYNPLWFNHKRLFNFCIKSTTKLQPKGHLNIPDWFIGFMGFLLFGLVIYYVNEQNNLSYLAEVSFFILLGSASISIGAMSDKKSWGLFLWTLLCCFFALYVAIVLQLYSIVLWVILSSLFLTAVFGLLFFKRKQVKC